MTAIQNMFDDRLISRGLLPARSPDLNPCGFYLWGALKSKVYMKNPHSLEELKQNIRYEIVAISENELLRVAEQVFRRCTSCQIAQGYHFEIELRIRYVYHYAVLIAKLRNESFAYGSVITCESSTVSSVRSLALDDSPGIIQRSLE